jgi:hypothetical protein
MLRRKNAAVAAAAAVFAAVVTGMAGTAIAHHGWSGYETDARKVSGTIEQMSYSNPHGSIKLKAADKTWTVILAPVNRMENRGLTEEMLKVGTNVSVEGYQHKTDTVEMRAERITVNGKTVELR